MNKNKIKEQRQSRKIKRGRQKKNMKHSEYKIEN